MADAGVPAGTAVRWWRPRDREPGDPPGRVFAACGVVLTLFSAWQETLPAGPNLLWAVALALGWLTLGTTWVVRVGAACVRPAGRRRLRRLWARWLVVPAAVLAIAVGLLADLPMRARFAVSEDALRDTAVAVREGREPDLGWVGLYEVVDAQAIPGGALLSVAGSGDAPFRRDGGFAYLPDGGPGAPDSTYFTHLTGPWYVWYVSG